MWYIAWTEFKEVIIAVNFYIDNIYLLFLEFSLITSLHWQFFSTIFILIFVHSYCLYHYFLIALFYRLSLHFNGRTNLSSYILSNATINSIEYSNFSHKYLFDNTNDLVNLLNSTVFTESKFQLWNNVQLIHELIFCLNQ